MQRVVVAKRLMLLGEPMCRKASSNGKRIEIEAENGV